MNRQRHLSIASAVALSLALSACGTSSADYDESYADAPPQVQWDGVETGSQGDGLEADYNPGAQQGMAQTQRPAQVQATGQRQAQAQAQPTGNSRAPATAAVNTTRMQPAQIMDADLRMPMATIQIPADWQMVGGLNWTDGRTCISVQNQQNWAIRAPDGRTVTGVIPGLNWQVGSQDPTNNCAVASFRSAREFLEARIRQLRPNAQVVSWTDRTAEAQEGMRKILKEGYPCYPEWPKPQPIQGQRVDGVELVVTYTENGVRMKEVLTAQANFFPQGRTTMGNVSGISFIRAPENMPETQLVALVKRIAETTCYNKQWVQASQQRAESNIKRYYDAIIAADNEWTARQINDINARGAQEAMRQSQIRQNIRMNTQNEINAINNATYNNTQQTNERIHRETLETIGEYETYRGTDGGTVQSSIHNGSNVYQNTNNPYNVITTDDPYFSPPADFEQLERVP
jgi:hypothetical protein